MPIRILIVAILAMCLGCAPSLVDLRYSVNRVSETYATQKPALDTQRVADGDACFAAYPPGDVKVRSCLDASQARWAPVEVAIAAVYAALVAAQGAVGTAEAAAAIGRAPSVMQVLVVVARAIEAGLGLNAAVEALHRQAVKQPLTPARQAPP